MPDAYPNSAVIDCKWSTCSRYITYSVLFAFSSIFCMMICLNKTSNFWVMSEVQAPPAIDSGDLTSPQVSVCAPGSPADSVPALLSTSGSHA